MQNTCLSYSEILLNIVRPEAFGESDQRADIEPLAFLDYRQEVAAKNVALVEFWKRNCLQGKPSSLIASPKARHYRTTTKRRVFFAHNKFRLRFSHRKDVKSPSSVLCSALEPKEHEAIYQFLLGKINSPAFGITAKHLTYIIIRGTSTEFCVVFNVDRVNGPVVRNLKALAENLRTLGLNIVSSFIFSDPTRSDYYLDKKQAPGGWKLKKLFGPDTLRLRVNGQTYRFPPVSFSQINESMVPVLLDTALRLCRPHPEGRFIDLYCGYGLFANYIGKRYGEVFAVDMDAASVDCGRETARHTVKKNGHGPRMYFRTAPISAASLESLLPFAGQREETLLLDPPRQGPARGVIAYCAQRLASRIVHLFCDIDRIPVDSEQWRHYGYRTTEIAALDMFPGTPNLEVVMLMEPI